MLVHLDTDLGGDTDDLCALAYLVARPDVEVVGVTTCCDAGGKRAGYAHRALELMGRADVPVAAGAAGSLGGYFAWIGADGPGVPEEAVYWPEPVAALPAEAGAALDLLERSCRQGAKVIGIGTYTNLALLEVARPGLLAGSGLVLMGGHLGSPEEGLPQWGPDMDWNVQLDTTAAAIVWERCRPLLVPLGVTLETWITRRDTGRLRRCGSVGGLLARQAEAHGQEEAMADLAAQYPALPADLLNFQYDSLACAVAAGWGGARVEARRIKPERRDGWLVPAETEEGLAVDVVTSVDGSAFNSHWLEVIESAWG